MPQWNTTRRNQFSSRSSQGSENSIAAELMRVVDLGLWVLIFVGPHLFGGRHFLGRFVIAAACVATALAWFVGQFFNNNAEWRRVSGLGILTLAIGTVTLQLVPVPAEWLTSISPRIAEILPLWHANATGLQIGEWQTISLAPEETRLALATLLAYAMLYVTAVQRLDSIDDITRIIRWIGCSAVIVAMFGIVQYLTANGKFFWFYEYPYTHTSDRLKAGFTSCNHFAHFLVLGLCCLLCWTMLRRVQRPSEPQTTKSAFHHSQGRRRINSGVYATTAESFAVALLVFAILASLSRGAVLAALAAILVLAVCYAAAGILRAKYVISMGLLSVLLMAALSMSGDYEQVTDRLATFTSRSLEDLDSGAGRRRVWSANLAAFQAGWLTGSGAGSHRFIYPLYLDEPVLDEFTHAENGYLQVATENGLAGVLLLVLVLSRCSRWCYSVIRNGAENRTMFILAVGIAGALAASIVHSLVDFVWFIPACATTTILLMACALRLAQLNKPRPDRSAELSRLSRQSRFNLVLASSMAGAWALVSLFPSARSSLEWDRYVLADKAMQSAESHLVWASSGTTAEDLVETKQLNCQSSLEHLANVLRMSPRSARAHVRFAGGLLNRFEALQQQSDNQMSIGQIREAASASKFPSQQDLRDWLERAFGNNCRLLYQARNHARQAVVLCPLQGEAYVYLAELSFLEGGDSAAVEAYSNQGLIVRPQDPDVLFAIGKRHLIEGNVDRALSLWRIAYRGASKYQHLINRILANYMTAANFVEVFRPTWAPLPHLWATYSASGRREDMEGLLSYASLEAARQIKSVSAAQAGLVWWGLAGMQREGGHAEKALESLQLAYKANPNNFSIRFELGHSLARSEQYDIAEPHLRWCLAQSPENDALRASLLRISRLKLQRIARSSSTTNN